MTSARRSRRLTGSRLSRHPLSSFAVSPTARRNTWSRSGPRIARRLSLRRCARCAYVVLPIDLIPDFVPVLGQLDDLAVVLLGLDLFIRSAPPDIVEEHLARISQDKD